MRRPRLALRKAEKSWEKVRQSAARVLAASWQLATQDVISELRAWRIHAKSGRALANCVTSGNGSNAKNVSIKIVPAEEVKCVNVLYDAASI